MSPSPAGGTRRTRTWRQEDRRVLRITSSQSGASALAYLNTGLSKDDYFAEHGAGHWQGDGAEKLGLSGEVTAEQFAALV
ncbi:MAG: relaxase domain-containing protein, partial [Gemmataceae bacterium]